jgi:hypothetical protein
LTTQLPATVTIIAMVKIGAPSRYRPGKIHQTFNENFGCVELARDKLAWSGTTTGLRRPGFRHGKP